MHGFSSPPPHQFGENKKGRAGSIHACSDEVNIKARVPLADQIEDAFAETLAAAVVVF